MKARKYKDTMKIRGADVRIQPSRTFRGSRSKPVVRVQVGKFLDDAQHFSIALTPFQAEHVARLLTQAASEANE